MSKTERRTVNGKSLLWLMRPYQIGMWNTIARHVPEPRTVVELGTNVGRWAKEMLRAVPLDRGAARG